MTRRFWIGLVIALPVLALEMGGHLTGLHMLLGNKRQLDTISFGNTGRALGRLALFVRGWQSLLTRNLNMFTLIALGTGVAWIIVSSQLSRRKSSCGVP
jgi:Cu+-exporting ATPase